LPFLFIAATAQADPLIIGNNAAFSGGPIQTYDFATGGAPQASFVPSSATGSKNGRGVAVFDGNVYYTELTSGLGASDGIHVRRLTVVLAVRTPKRFLILGRVLAFKIWPFTIRCSTS